MAIASIVCLLFSLVTQNWGNLDLTVDIPYYSNKVRNHFYVLYTISRTRVFVLVNNRTSWRNSTIQFKGKLCTAYALHPTLFNDVNFVCNSR